MSTNVTVEPMMGTTTSTPSQRMTFEEFLRREHEGIVEWVNGEVTIMSVAEIHQRIVQLLVFLLEGFLQVNPLGRIRTAPYAMRAKPDGPGREPDVMFVATENLGRLEQTHLNGPADLIVEVVSDESVARDRADKFYEYQAAGVREYWMIDPRPNYQRVDFYVLDEHGRYQPIPISGDGTYCSTVLSNFWLRVDWLWADEPNPLMALAEIVGVEKLIAALQHK